MQHKRQKRDLTWQEIAYGLIVLAIVLWVIIQAAIHGTGSNPGDNW